MSAIGKAIGPLVNIALLLLFAIIIFAIIGLEFYAGALNKTCYDLSDLSKNLTTNFLIIINLVLTFCGHTRTLIWKNQEKHSKIELNWR